MPNPHKLVAEVKPENKLADVYELDPENAYMVVVGDNIDQVGLEQFSKRLKDMGVNAVVVRADELKLYRFDQKEPG